MIAANLVSLYLRCGIRFLLGSEPFKLAIDGAEMWVRPRSSDVYVLWETFLQKDYEVKERVEGTVVDLGANIGDFCVWCAKKYKPRRIVAVEMEAENFGMLKKNIALNGEETRIVPVRAAVAERNGWVSIKKAKFNLGIHKVGGAGGDVEAVTMGEFWRRNKLVKVDMLKMDIEGAERQLMTKANQKYFRKIKHVVLEAHEQEGFGYHVPRGYLEGLGFKVESRPMEYAGCMMLDAVNLKA